MQINSSCKFIVSCWIYKLWCMFSDVGGRGHGTFPPSFSLPVLHRIKHHQGRAAPWRSTEDGKLTIILKVILAFFRRFRRNITTLNMTNLPRRCHRHTPQYTLWDPAGNRRVAYSHIKVLGQRNNSYTHTVMTALSSSCWGRRELIPTGYLQSLFFGHQVQALEHK